MFYLPGMHHFVFLLFRLHSNSWDVTLLEGCFSDNSYCFNCQCRHVVFITTILFNTFTMNIIISAVGIRHSSYFFYEFVRCDFRPQKPPQQNSTHQSSTLHCNSAKFNSPITWILYCFCILVL